MPKEAPYPGTQSVQRAFALLKSFTDEKPELSLSDLINAVHLNKTTTYRLLMGLEREGMVSRRPDTDAYRLGPEAIALGGRALRANNIRIVGHPELEAFVREIGETATLEVLRQDKVLIIDEVLGNHLVGTTSEIGARWPAHATSSGKVLLAHLPETEKAAALKNLEPLTEKTLTNPKTLSAEFDRIREQGFSIADEELEIGLIGVAAPIRNHEGLVIATVSTAGPSTRITEAKKPEIINRIREAADRISKQLGYQI